MKTGTQFISIFLVAVLCVLAGCKSHQTSSRKRLSVVTYDKKRGTRSTSPSQRHYSARRSGRKENYSNSNGPGASKAGAVAATRNTSSEMAASGQARKVIQVARSYMGTPYRYGGSSRSGMDCSGLLCTSFESVNIKLPRPSYEQAQYGEKVGIEDVQPGDLVFFSERKSSNKVVHVGMVTAVNGREDVTFIHSSTSRGVVEDNLHSEYYRKIFVKAIRPF